MKRNGTLNGRELEKAIGSLATDLASNGAQVHLDKGRNGTATPQRPRHKKITPKKISVAEEPAKPAKVVLTAAPVAKPAGSLLDEILQAGGEANHVAEAIVIANTILSNEKAVATFVDTIVATRALYMNKLGFNRQEENVRDQFHNLDLPGIEKQLGDWSKEGDPVAKKLLVPLAAFRKSAVDVMGPLWNLYVEIIRPCLQVETYYDLSILMKSLMEKRLVDRFTNRRHYPERAILIGDRQASAYLPAMERGNVIPMVEAGWKWVKLAESTAKETASGRSAQLTKLSERITAGFTPDDAKNGKEGFILLRTGPNSGALIHIRDGKFHITEAVGISTQMRPWIGVDSKRSDWPNAHLHDAFQVWKNVSVPTDKVDQTA